MATKGSKQFHIADGKKCKDSLEVIYECYAHLVGDQMTLDSMQDASDLLKYAYVVRGNGFALDIHIWCQDMTDQVLYEFLMKDLIDDITVTKMWSDLCLLASVQRTGQSSISLSLQHDESGMYRSREISTPRAGYSSSLRPPVGVTVLNLNHVDVYLEFKDNAFSSWTDSNLSPSKCSPPGRLSVAQSFTCQLPKERQNPYCRPRDSFSALEDDDDDDDSDSHDEGERKTHSSPTATIVNTILSCTERLSSQNAKNSSVISSSSRSNEIYLQLIDSVLRVSLLGGKPMTNLDSATNQITARLSQICPSMFSPGYLTALNERTYLIPSICRSVMQISRRSRSQIASQISLVDLETSLWKATWPRLFNPKASKMIHPLVDMDMYADQGKNVDALDSAGLDARAMAMIDLLDHFQDLTEFDSVSEVDSESRGDENMTGADRREEARGQKDEAEDYFDELDDESPEGDGRHYLEYSAAGISNFDASNQVEMMDCEENDVDLPSHTCSSLQGVDTDVTMDNVLLLFKSLSSDL